MKRKMTKKMKEAMEKEQATVQGAVTAFRKEVLQEERKQKIILIFWFIVGAILTYALAFGFIIKKAEATTDVCFCHDAFKKHPVTVCTDDEGLINGHQKHVDDAKDTLGACTIPTATPTVTPIITGTPIPTPTGEVSPTPIPEPTNSPVQFTGVSDGRSDGLGGTPYTPVVCNGVSLAPAIISGFERVSPTEVRFDWFPSTDSHGKQAIVYGYSQDRLEFGVDNLASDSRSFTIGGLAPNVTVWASIWTYRDACMTASGIVDP